MPKPELSSRQVSLIVNLRKTGHSLPEIKKLSGHSGSTVLKYISGVCVLPRFQKVLREKQGGSKARSLKEWQVSKERARKLILPFCRRDFYLILALLYWGEGNKKELNLINSDPSLVKLFVDCLRFVGVYDVDFKISLRIFGDLEKEKVIQYWLNLLKLNIDNIISIDVLDGRKEGKLQYGMCRVRVRKGGEYFKLVMSMIDLIRSIKLS